MVEIQNKKLCKRMDKIVFENSQVDFLRSLAMPAVCRLFSAPAAHICSIFLLAIFQNRIFLESAALKFNRRIPGPFLIFVPELP